MHGVTAYPEGSPELGVQNFVGGLHHVRMIHELPTWLISVSRSIDTVRPEAQSHIVGLFG